MSSHSHLRRRVPRVFVLLLMIAGLLVPAGAAGADAGSTASKMMASREAKKFKADGKVYSLTVSASTIGGQESVNISFTRTKSLAGGRSTSQSHSLGFDSTKGVVAVAKDLKSGGIRSGKPNQLRPQAVSRLAFKGTSALQRSCGGKTTTRNGVWTGKLRFEAGKLGAVTVNMDGVKALATSSTCDGETPTTFPCPTASKGVSGSVAPSADGKTLNLSANRVAGARSATVSAWMSRPLKAAHPGVSANHSQFFYTEVAPKKVQVPNHLNSASFSAPKASFMPGSGSYESFMDASEFTYPCGKSGAEVVNVSSRGTVKSNIVLKSDVTAYRKLKGTPLDHFSGASRQYKR